MVATMAKKPEVSAEVGAGRTRKSAPIQVERDLARMAAVIASHDGITQSDLISPHLRPFLLTHYRRVQQAIHAELKGSDRVAGE